MEKPILFNTKMVQAILQGNKTQTRRIVKEQPKQDELLAKADNEFVLAEDNKSWQKSTEGEYIGRVKHSVKPPYNVGDILWVRETWTKIEAFVNYADYEINKDLKYLYKCDDNGIEHAFIDVGVKKWRPSIHMPRAAARLFLRVTNVKAERLQDITEDGAKAEGADKATYDLYTEKYSNDESTDNYKDGFHKIWDSCYQWPKSWINNNWVWVIEFEKVEDNHGSSL
jgi:hypothetical protein